MVALLCWTAQFRISLPSSPMIVARYSLLSSLGVSGKVTKSGTMLFLVRKPSDNITILKTDELKRAASDSQDISLIFGGT